MTALLLETTRDLTTRLSVELRRREGEKLKRQAVRDLVGSAAALAGLTLSAWTRVREALEEEGFEGRELIRHCQLLLGGIDGTLSGYKRLVALAEESGLTPEAAGLPDLEAKLAALRESRPRVVAVLRLAARLPRPVDEAVLAESRAAIERGESIPLDDYLARLRATEGF
jgi:hypothetical protein